MTCPDFFSSSIFGVIIGAIVAGVFSYFTMRAQLKNQREIAKEQHITQKREDLYLEACDLLLEFDMFVKNKLPFSDELKIKYNKLQSRISVYASNPIYKQYYNIANSIIKQNTQDVMMLTEIANFINMIKKELGIKDV